MAHLIDKDETIAEINALLDDKFQYNSYDEETGFQNALFLVKKFIDTLEVKDPYEQCVQYPSVEYGIQSHAETYSFNIESELFNQLTKEQQKLWRKEIERACISGGEVGVEFARDPRYKENLKVKEVNLGKEINKYISDNFFGSETMGFFTVRTNEEPNDQDIALCAQHFFNLGLSAGNKGNKAQKGE